MNTFNLLIPKRLIISRILKEKKNKEKKKMNFI